MSSKLATPDGLLREWRRTMADIRQTAIVSSKYFYSH